MTFYPVSDWPYVAILDPRTGEHLVTWNKIDAATFCDLVTEFLSLHPSLDPSNDDKDSSKPSEPKNKKPKVVSNKKTKIFTRNSFMDLFLG